MSELLLLLNAASNLNFDDFEEQKKYETISFKEIISEIIELKVLSPLTSCIICNPICFSFFLLWNWVTYHDISFCIISSCP